MRTVIASQPGDALPALERRGGLAAARHKTEQRQTREQHDVGFGLGDRNADKDLSMIINPFCSAYKCYSVRQVHRKRAEVGHPYAIWTGDESMIITCSRI